MSMSLDAPSQYQVPFFETNTRLAALTAILLGLYLGLAILTLRTNRPDVDDAAFANPSYNLIFNGFMGTTIYGEHGAVPVESLRRHTYWAPPLYILANAAFFKAFGFGFFQARTPSILWGLVALAAWYALIRSGGNSPAVSVIVTGFIAVGYFFQLASSLGRMDMMCLALGTSGLASYVVLRKSHFPLAVFLSNTLVVLSGLTHAVGIMYFCGLVFLTLFQDWRKLRWRHLALAAVPYFVGAVGWGAYIMQDPGGFREQMHGNFVVTSQAAGMPAVFSPLAALKQEIIRRYLDPFGLGPGVPLRNRAKAIVLLAYALGLGGILCTKRLRGDSFLRTLLVLAGIDFAVLAFVATSKNYYYLPHTTAVFSACLGLFLLRLPAQGSRAQLSAVAVLAGLAAVQMLGLVIRARQNPFEKSYLPAIESIRLHSEPRSLIFGPAELWLYLQPDRTLLHEWTLGYFSGLRGKLIVLDPMLLEFIEVARIEEPAIYKHIEGVIEGSRKVYDDGYYEIYQPSH